MNLLAQLRRSIGEWLGGSEGTKQIGVYGPPNSGKSTLSNKMLRDWDRNEMGPESEVPHQTRQVKKKEGVVIESDSGDVELDIADTPGVETKVSAEEFMEFDLDEDAAQTRAREATQGISESISWLKSDIDGVLYVIDSTEDPTAQVNAMILGIIEEMEVPTLVLANKIDLEEESDVERVEEAYPDHKVVPVSAKEGLNMDELYDEIVRTFGR